LVSEPAALVSAALLHRHREDLAPIHSNKLLDSKSLTPDFSRPQIWPVFLCDPLVSQETRYFHRSVFANSGTLVGLALEEEDAGAMANYMGLTDKTEQTQAKEMLLYQANGQALVRSQHFLPYAQVQILSFEDRLSKIHEGQEE